MTGGLSFPKGFLKASLGRNHVFSQLPGPALRAGFRQMAKSNEVVLDIFQAQLSPTSEK